MLHNFSEIRTKNILYTLNIYIIHIYQVIYQVIYIYIDQNTYIKILNTDET